VDPDWSNKTNRKLEKNSPRTGYHCEGQSTRVAKRLPDRATKKVRNGENLEKRGSNTPASRGRKTKGINPRAEEAAAESGGNWRKWMKEPVGKKGAKKEDSRNIFVWQVSLSGAVLCLELT